MNESVRPSPRFWIAYAVGWAPVAAAYFGFIVAAPTRSLADATRLALVNVIPAALCGIGVVHLCLHVARPKGEGRGWAPFLLLHLLGATGFSLLWLAGLTALLSLGDSLGAGAPQLRMLTFEELRWQLSAGMLLYGTMAGILYVAQAHTEMQAESAHAAHAEALRARAEMQALRAQLSPHFLFNTLHSLLELVSTADPRAEEAIERFADIFHYVYDTRADLADDVPLQTEIDFVGSYLNVERLRLGDRLRVITEYAPETLEVAVPRFMLQPLVENAIKHAISRRGVGGTIHISSRMRAGLLHLTVRDDGPGATMDAVAATQGVGLRLVTSRVAMRFGEASHVTVQTRPGEGFAVTLVVPALETRLETRSRWQRRSDASNPVFHHGRP